MLSCYITRQSWMLGLEYDMLWKCRKSHSILVKQHVVSCTKWVPSYCMMISIRLHICMGIKGPMEIYCMVRKSSVNLKGHCILSNKKRPKRSTVWVKLCQPKRLMYSVKWKGTKEITVWLKKSPVNLKGHYSVKQKGTKEIYCMGKIVST